MTVGGVRCGSRATLLVGELLLLLLATESCINKAYYKENSVEVWIRGEKFRLPLRG